MIMMMVVLRMRPQAIRKVFGSLETKGISCIVMRCYGKKKEMWYQEERNKETSVLQKRIQEPILYYRGDEART